MYLALFGDVKRSRDMDNRSVAQQGLLKILDEANERMRDRLAVPFSLSQGDEFQGLLAAPQDAVAGLTEFDRHTHLFDFRYGLGWGEISTSWSDRTTEMDGSCFHAARNALEHGKVHDRWATFRAADPDEDRDRVLNGQMSFIQMIRDSWTDKQRHAVAQRRGHQTQTDAANSMGITKSTLSKMLKAASYEMLRETEVVLELLLRDYLSPKEIEVQP